MENRRCVELNVLPPQKEAVESGYTSPMKLCAASNRGNEIESVSPSGHVSDARQLPALCLPTVTSMNGLPSSQVNVGVPPMVAQNEVHASLLTVRVYTESARQPIVPTFTSQPSFAMSLQSEKPGVHRRMPHLPDKQDGVPFLIVHLYPQDPQLLGSEFRLTSQPLAELPSQSAEPGPQRLAPPMLIPAALPVSAPPLLTPPWCPVSVPTAPAVADIPPVGE